MRILSGLTVGAIIAATALAIDSSLVVDLGYGKFQGVANETVGVDSWFGLRYAAPPTGALRWRAPVPIEKSSFYSRNVTIDASNTGPICPQGYPGWRYNSTPGSSTPVRGNEDCLLLDVLAPAKPSSASLPVMVQIHGGGYTQNYAEYYPGYGVVNVSHGNLVYITIQYRLGAYGFLSSAEIRHDGTANAGLLDQRLALEWVQRHAQAFGGDPDRMTIIGGSAGGGSVMNQMIMYGGVSNPPFRAAIAEYPWWQTYHNDTTSELQFRQMLQATGCQTLTCMRQIPESQLLKAQQDVFSSAYPQHYGYGDFYFGPSVDGAVIRDLPSQELQQGHFSKVPLITLRDAYEGYGYTNQSLKGSSGDSGVSLVQADISKLYPGANKSFFARLFQLYDAATYNATFWQRSAMFSDAVVNCPSYFMASAVSNYAPAWKMIFQAGSQLHGSNTPYLWTNGYGRQNGTLAHILKDYYISFAVHLDPNRESYSNTPKPSWPVYLDSGRHLFSVLQVNDTNIAERPDFDANSNCDFWAANSYIIRN